jgi:hypothetical protein
MDRTIRPLSPMEIEEISNRTRGLSEEEREVVLHNLPTSSLQNELNRRVEYVNEKIDNLYNIITSWENEIADPSVGNLINLQNFIKVVKESL